MSIDDQSKHAVPDFSSLSMIMKRFNEVPFVQFQRELNTYFDRNFSVDDQELSSLQREQMLAFKKQVMGFADDLFGQADAVEKCKDLLK